MPGAAKSRSRRRTVAIIAGVVVVVLGVTAGIVIPQIQRAQHAQRVEDYTALVEQLRDIYQSQAETETTLHAAAALAHTRHTEMLNAANAVEELGQAPEPMLPESHAQALEMVGASAAEELGPVDESGPAAAVQSQIAAAAVDEFLVEVEEQAAKAEKEAAEAKRKAEEEAARKRASQGNSSSEGWGSKGLCNYWAPMGGGMYMAPCP